MTQYFRQVIAPGSTGFNSESFEGNPVANVAYRETNGVAAVVILRGPDGDSTDNVAANGQGLIFRKKLSQIVITGNGASITIDARGPDEYIDPRFLTATISGTTTVAGSVTANIGTPGNLALEAGGHLATMQADIATIKANTNVLASVTSDGSGNLNVKTH